MFGFGKKKKQDAFDLVIIKTEESSKRKFHQVVFPTQVSNDIMVMFKKLQKSPFNKKNYLGDLGGFRMITHVQGFDSVDVLNEEEAEATPMQIQDFANILLRRLENLENNPEFEDSEDLAFIMGELTMLRDGSFLKVEM
ncbi:hypothetical protein [Brevibacillus dissolubilis]|uniref:hypothetical protein n=1 Tax=Brevibacillus dissolubilis TaxID=1844116 RepID=UPI001115EECD|nr:hypothetical protein [Brevibacillus dissolubilis]